MNTINLSTNATVMMEKANGTADNRKMLVAGTILSISDKMESDTKNEGAAKNNDYILVEIENETEVYGIPQKSQLTIKLVNQYHKKLSDGKIGDELTAEKFLARKPKVGSKVAFMVNEVNSLDSDGDVNTTYFASTSYYSGSKIVTKNDKYGDATESYFVWARMTQNKKTGKPQLATPVNFFEKWPEGKWYFEEKEDGSKKLVKGESYTAWLNHEIDQETADLLKPSGEERVYAVITFDPASVKNVMDKEFPERIKSIKGSGAQIRKVS